MYRTTVLRQMPWISKTRATYDDGWFYNRRATVALWSCGVIEQSKFFHRVMLKKNLRICVRLSQQKSTACIRCQHANLFRTRPKYHTRGLRCICCHAMLKIVWCDFSACFCFCGASVLRQTRKGFNRQQLHELFRRKWPNDISQMLAILLVR